MFTDERGIEDLQVVLSRKVGGNGRAVEPNRNPHSTLSREGLEDGGQV